MSGYLGWLLFFVLLNLPSSESRRSNGFSVLRHRYRFPSASLASSLPLPSSSITFVTTTVNFKRRHPPDYLRIIADRSPSLMTVLHDVTIVDGGGGGSNELVPSSSSSSRNKTKSNDNLDDDDDPFTLLSTVAATTLLQSDRRRDAIGKESGAQASSATNWIDEGCAFTLRQAMDKMELYFPNYANIKNNDNILMDATARRRRDEEASAWLRWMRSVPMPVLVDLSIEARGAADGFVSDDFLELLNANNASSDKNINDNSSSITTNAINDSSSSKMRRLRTEFLNRLQCRLILLPSGQGLRGGLREPAGSLTFAKLLSGGATRYRILPSSTSSKNSGGGGNNDTTTNAAGPVAVRRAGERTERKSSRNEHIPSWVQYGGTERRYEAIDMGPAMILELTLLPKIRGGDDDDNSIVGVRERSYASMSTTDMVLKRLAWRPQTMFQYVQDEEIRDGNGSGVSGDEDVTSKSSHALRFVTASSLQGKECNDALSSDFCSRVGGLGQQIEAIVRRVLDGRVIRPAEVDADGNFLSFPDSRRMLEGGITGSGSANNTG